MQCFAWILSCSSLFCSSLIHNLSMHAFFVSWKLTVMYFWFPKPTILARRRLTGLRSREMSGVPATIAVAIPLLGGVAM